MRFLFHSLLGFFLFAVGLGLTGYAGYWVLSAVQARMAEGQQVPPRRERTFAVKVMTAEARTETPELRAFGEIQSRRTLDIRARATGTVVRLADSFVEGGRVAQGELLVQIDPADAQAQFDRSAADVLDAEAASREASRTLVLAGDELAASRDQLALREKLYRRHKDLAGRGVGSVASEQNSELDLAQARQSVLVSRRALALAETAVDQAATRLNRARITRDEAGRRLAETTIRAEFSGTLGNVTVVQGGMVADREQLAQLVDPDALEVAFRVPTRAHAYLLDAGGHLADLPVTLSLSGFEDTLQATGRISRDNAVVGTGDSGRLIFASIDDATGFKPGDFVTVTVDEPPLERVIRLPARALGVDGTVLVLGTGNRLREHRVRVLRHSGETVLVAAEPGLTGERVVSERTPLLGPGIRVEPQDPAAGVTAARTEG